MNHKYSILLLGLCLQISSAQTSVVQPAVQAMDLKLGRWEVTITTTGEQHVSVDPEKLAQLSPMECKMALDAQKSLNAARPKPVLQKRTLCITAQNLANGSFIIGNTGCPLQATSSVQKLVTIAKCPQIEQTSEFERIDSEHFRGSLTQNTGPAENVTKLHQIIAGSWLRANCIPDAQEMQALGIAAGANKDVLSFLPYLPPIGAGGEGRLGRYFVYFWHGEIRKFPRWGTSEEYPADRKDP